MKKIYKIILEHFYLNRPCRFYSKYAPAIRSERTGLLTGLEVDGEISNSITSVLKDNYVCMEEEKKIKTPRPEGKGWCWDENNGKWFRIRKLTPRECFRLMDVSDADFDKLLVMETTGKDNKQKRVISDSQLYKMAGNSIVVACMDLIFENLFFPAKRESSLF